MAKTAAISYPEELAASLELSDEQVHRVSNQQPCRDLMMHLRRCLTLFPTAFAVSLVWLGCQGSSADWPSAESEHAVPSVVFALDWAATPDYAPFLIAHEEGFDRRHGVNIKIVEGNGAPNNAILISNGTYPIGTCSGFATVIGASQGLQIVSVAAILQTSPVVVFSLPQAGIEEPSDLRGKRIGVRYGSEEFYQFRALLRKYGIRPGDVREVAVDASPQALLTGDLDAVTGYRQNQPAQLRAQGVALDEFEVADFGIDPYGTNVIANRQFLEQHPETIRRVLAAVSDAWAYVRGSSQEAAKKYLEMHADTDGEFFARSLRATLALSAAPADRPFGFQARGRWAETADLLKVLDLISNEPAPETLFTNDFLPASVRPDLQEPGGQRGIRRASTP